jgi:hypothetical protein
MTSFNVYGFLGAIPRWPVAGRRAFGFTTTCSFKCCGLDWRTTYSAILCSRSRRGRPSRRLKVMGGRGLRYRRRESVRGMAARVGRCQWMRRMCGGACPKDSKVRYIFGPARRGIGSSSARSNTTAPQRTTHDRRLYLPWFVGGCLLLRLRRDSSMRQ